MTNQTISSFPPVSGLSGAEVTVVDQADINNNLGTFSASINQISTLISGRITSSYPPLAPQSANTVFAGPTTGAPALPAFRGIQSGDLPPPTATNRGVVTTFSAVAHQWITSLDTAGNFHSSQPALSDLQSIVAHSVVCNPSSSPGPPVMLVGANPLDVLQMDPTGTILQWGPAPTGTLIPHQVTYGNIVQGVARSVMGVPGNVTADHVDIVAPGSSNFVLRESGGTIGFGTIAQQALGANIVGNVNLRQSTALSVMGNGTGALANVTDIAATPSSGAVLVESAGTLGFGQVTGAGIANNAVGTNQIAALAVTTAKINAFAVQNSQLRQSAGLSVMGNAAVGTGNVSDILANAGSGAVLRESGGTLGFGQVASAGIATNAVGNTQLRQSGPLSVIGNSSNAVANPNDIVASVGTGQVLREFGGTLAFGPVASNGIAGNAVGNAQLRQGAGLSVIGNATNATANVADIVGSGAFNVLQIDSTGSSLIWGPAPAGTIGPHQVTYGNIVQGAGLSVMGVTGNVAADHVDITATAASGAVLRESAGTLGFGQIATAGITNNAVTLAKVQQVAAASVIGNPTNATANATTITGSPNQALVISAAGTSVGFGTVSVAGGGTGASTPLGALAAILPIGLILPYAAATAPTGFLLCFGQNVSRTTYAALFALLSTTYGAGDGSTTFGLPDLRGRFVAGKDDMGGTAAGRLTAAGGVAGTTLGATGGNQLSILSTANLPAHTHGVGTLVNGVQSADHTHSINLNSGTESAAHSHSAISGGSVRANFGSVIGPGSAAGGFSNLTTEDTLHVHNVAGATSGISANHTHTITGSTDSGPGTGTGLPVVAPTLVATYIIFAGA